MGLPGPQGPAGPPGSVGIMGPKGDSGDEGENNAQPVLYTLEQLYMYLQFDFNTYFVPITEGVLRFIINL